MNARSDATFKSGGVECAAWLYRPESSEAVPLVVMAHGFSATRELRLDAYAERFCDAGVGVLLFDYRHFGASAGEPRQLLDIRKQQEDYRAAIGYARSLDWVDADRIALFGTSFSGGHVLAVAAGDDRIAAVVAQGPFTSGLASAARVPPANALKGLVAGLRDQIGSLIGWPPHYVAAAGPPGSFAAMTSPDAMTGMESLVPPESRWENRVAARIGLHLIAYRPGAASARIRCPVLFCVCDGDAVTPPKATLRFARRAREAEVKRYPIGHFAIYTGEAWERAVADQTDFLTRHLRVAAVSPEASPGPSAAG